MLALIRFAAVAVPSAPPARKALPARMLKEARGSAAGRERSRGMRILKPLTQPLLQLPPPPPPPLLVLVLVLALALALAGNVEGGAGAGVVARPVAQLEADWLRSLQWPPRPPCLKPRLHAEERWHCVSTPAGARLCDRSCVLAGFVAGAKAALGAITGRGARGGGSSARDERFVPRAMAVVDGPAPPTLGSSSPGRVRVVLGSIGGPVPALAPDGSHTWQNQSPSGMVCNGGTRHCWWKERPQSGLSQRRMSLPA